MKNISGLSNTNIQSKWVTTAEAAEYLKCSEEFLNTDRVANRYGIPFCRLGRRIRYCVDDLDEYLSNTKNCKQ